MLGVAKKGITPEPDPTPEDRHRYPVISLRAPDHIRALLKKMARQQRRSVSQTLLFIVEEHLAAKGLLPPPEAP